MINLPGYAWLTQHLPFHFAGLDPLGDWIVTGWLLGLLPFGVAFSLVIPTWVRDTGRDLTHRHVWVAAICTLLWPIMMVVGFVHDMGVWTVFPFRRRRALLAQRGWLLDAAESYERQAEQLDGVEDAHAATCRHAANQLRLAGRGHRPVKERVSA